MIRTQLRDAALSRRVTPVTMKSYAAAVDDLLIITRLRFSAICLMANEN